MDKHRKEHNQLQSNYFDKKFNIFCQPIPQEVKARLKQIVQAAALGAGSKVLDVGTGCGVLIYYFIDVGVASEDILGLDLTKSMLEQAKSRYPEVKFLQQDILDFAENAKFDAVFFNACFGNLFDQQKTIAKTKELLNDAGRIIISHPLGARFVAGLHKNEPELVPHLLPDKAQLLAWAQCYNLTLERFDDEPLLYLAVLRAV
jgi:riboflavin kinase